MIDMNIIRLFISQTFTIYLALLLIPLKTPVKKNTYIVILVAALITLMNAGLIIAFGIAFYVKYYFFTLSIPHVVLFSIFAYYKGSKLIFALLATQIIGNFAVINGSLLSYLIYKENTPFLGFSVGLTYFPNDGLTVDELIDLADKYMYKDKRGIIDSNVQIDTVC